MKRKSLMVCILAATLFGTSLAGCGSKDEGSGSDNTDNTDNTDNVEADAGQDSDKPFAGQEITFIDTGAGDWEDNLEPIVEKFEEETGATVNIELYAHADYLEMLQVKLESGSDDYDVIGVDVPLVSSYAYKDWIVSVDDWFTDEEKAQFTDSSLEAGCYDGKFYSPCMNSSSQLLWYNTALLEEAGVEVPESSTEDRLTWEEVTDMAKQTLEKIDPDGNKGICGITFGQVSRTYQMNQLPNSMGGKNISDDGYTTTGVITDEAWVNSATWFQNLFNDGLSQKGINADDAGDYFRAGKVVFIIDGTWMANSCDKEGMATYGYAPVPAFEGYEDQVGTPTGSWHFGIPKNAKNKDLAAEFIKYMSIGEGNETWIENNGDVPGTKAGVEKLMESDTAEEYMKIAAYESANTAVPRALTPGYTEYDTNIQAAWEDIKNGADVKETLDSTAEKIDKALEKYKE